MTDAIAVLNAGSSSLKFSLFSLRGDRMETELHGQVEGLDHAPRLSARDRNGALIADQSWASGAGSSHADALPRLLDFLRDRIGGSRLVAVGHRVVHGGQSHWQPVLVTGSVLASLEALVPLAPLHQPHNLAPIKALLAQEPGLPQVACFDTAFHHGAPDLAQMFALPAPFHAEGVRRYGFHGLSYEYIASVLPGIDPGAAAGRCVVLHLGNGASMCALLAGRSIATTMGFTALDGLMMGTRCGSLDPGVVLYLMGQRGMDSAALLNLLYNESGLLGVSGISSDMRTVLASAEPRARLAVDLYVYRIRRELGSLVAALGGLDALIFTAGIGENAAVIRERVCQDAAWLQVELDPEANGSGGHCITSKKSRVRAWVIPTNEELMIARHTRRILEAPLPPGAD